MPASAVADGGMERIARIADSQRTRLLDAYERLYKGLAYDGRPSFWDASVPLQERAPCVHSGVPEAAGRRLSALVFGARQYPRVTAPKGARGSVEIDNAIKEITKRAALPLVLRKALIQGIMCGTWCLVLGLVEGVPSATIIPAKHATPRLGPNGRVLSLDVRYRYQDGERVMWYRRSLDATTDTVYLPVEAHKDGHEPTWIEDPSRSVSHGLGFCPVIWHRHDADPSDTDDIDGTPLFAGMEDELEALDFAMSQRHRNGRYNGEPQVVVTGASADGMSAAGGRTARVPAPTKGPGDAAFSWFNSMFGAKRGGDSATQKAPGKVWFFEQGASAQMLESSGAGARVLTEDAEGIRRAILEARAIVIASPEQVGANASAALMETLHAPMIDHADTLRTEYEPCVVEVVTMLLRICRAAGTGVRMPSVVAALPFLAEIPELTLAWGRYFEPTLGDISQAFGAASVATGGAQLLTPKTALKWLANVASIDDIEAEASAVEDDRETDAAVLASLPVDGAVPVDGAAVADTALNGAQVSSLVEILASVASGALPLDTSKALILAAFPSFDEARVERMLAPLRNRAPTPAPLVTP